MADTIELIPYVGTRTPADFDTLFDELVAARGSAESLSARLSADDTADTKQVAAIAEIIDSGSKNRMKQSSGQVTSSWIDIPVDLPAGTWVVSFTSLTSTDTDASTCRGRFFTAGVSAVSNYFSIPRGSNVSATVTTTGEAAILRINPSDTVEHSSGDTITVAGGMICTQAEFDVAPDFAAYKPDAKNRILAPTGDTTDRANEILALLTKYGECELLAGEYYCAGFEMPAGTTLIGAGKQTVMRLPDSVESGYCVRIHRYATVKDIYFKGGDEAPVGISTDGTTVGTRHGIYLAANADGEGTSHTDSIINRVSGCWFEFFSGGGFTAENTGTGKFAGVLMEGCVFRQCMVGINIPYYSEYNRFTNCVTEQCNIGCINNGGNNTFTSCTFHGVKGFVIDNTNNDKTNNAHGTCSACTFNHINNMNTAPGGGLAVYIKNAANGFVFDSCQFWYGAISVSGSKGIHFSDCLIGGGTPTITVTGDYGAWFDGCTFQNAPTISANVLTRFDNCYNGQTGEQVSPNPALVAAVNGEPKNKLATASGQNESGSLWVDIPIDLPAGTWVVSFTSLTSTDTDSTTCRIRFYTDAYSAVSNYYQVSRGSNVSVVVTTTGTAGVIRMNASSDNDKSTGDTVTFAGAMVCSVAAWQVSQKYVAYAPTPAEMWAAIQAL